MALDERDLSIDAILVTVLETATATVEYVIITAARGWPVRVGRGIVVSCEESCESHGFMDAHLPMQAAAVGLRRQSDRLDQPPNPRNAPCESRLRVAPVLGAALRDAMPCVVSTEVREACILARVRKGHCGHNASAAGARIQGGDSM